VSDRELGTSNEKVFARIKHENGTYFEKYVSIGPMFGATKDEAWQFDSEAAAQKVIDRDWRMSGSCVEVA
jgi:hypothetical protein